MLAGSAFSGSVASSVRIVGCAADSASCTAISAADSACCTAISAADSACCAAISAGPGCFGIACAADCSSADGGVIPGAASGAGAPAGLAPGSVACPPNAEVTAFSAVVTSLGITQNVLPAPLASCGSVCRYW